MGCGRRGRLPNHQRRWNDIGEIRNQKSEIAQQEKSDGCEERQRLAPALDRAPCRECDERGHGGDPPENKIFGSENHRAAMRSKASGIHRLTIAMKASTTTSSALAVGRARSAIFPSVFMMSQVAPSSA